MHEDRVLTSGAVSHPPHVAVVDAGRHLLSFDRMDTAEIAGPHLALDKAATVAHRCPSGDLAEEALPTGTLASLGSSGGGLYVVFAGGLPLWSLPYRRSRA